MKKKLSVIHVLNTCTSIPEKFSWILPEWLYNQQHAEFEECLIASLSRRRASSDAVNLTYPQLVMVKKAWNDD